MAEARVNLEPEVDAIFEQINAKANFLLSGGAGSGKTYSLVSVINEIFRRRPSARVACITYTNAAVRQIQGRIADRGLVVSTIHEFLWGCISLFQKELKVALLTLAEDPDVKINATGDELTAADLADKTIRYKEYLSLKDGVISHDELLILANFMFKKHVKLRNILADRFNFILIDEYQDTSPLVVEIFLNFFRGTEKRPLFGFFGDAMQSIYDDTVGNLERYVISADVIEIKKEQNRRNPRLVIELANRLRIDGIVQHASTDMNAPNMQDGKLIDGEIRFFYSTTAASELDKLKAILGWNFGNTRETKELNLTHNLIAPRAGFSTLMQIYDADKVLEYKVRITKYIKENAIVDDFSEMTFGQVVEHLKLSAAKPAAVLPTPGQKTFIDEHPALFAEALGYPFEEIRRTYVDAKQLIDDKKQDEDDESKPSSERDALIKHLFRIQATISQYADNRLEEVLKATEFKILKIADKRRLRDAIAHLNGMSNQTIEQVIDYADHAGICKKDDRLSAFREKRRYLYNRVKGVRYGDFQELYKYLEGKTPFSTQHKIKGDQFDNVLVVMDNGRWANYNFAYLFEENGNPSVLERTRKLFYVCCTRAKRSLAVYYESPSAAVIEKAKLWFGGQNVVKM